MKRYVEHPRITPEHLLCSVPVVHVPVDDGHTTESAVERMGGSNCDVVDQAEAHGTARSSVVSWRSQQCDASRHAAVEEGIDEVDTPPGSALGSWHGARCKVGIRVELTLLTREAPQILEVSSIMN